MEERLIVVGRVARTYGSGGELLVVLFDTFPRDYHMEEPLFVVIDGLAVPLFCTRFERRGRKGALVVFADMENERRAAGFLGLELKMEASRVQKDGGHLEEEEEDGDDEGRIYLEDLAGWTTLIDGTRSGVIEDFIEGDNPLFRILVDGREVYVPAVDEFITAIDPAARTISLELPEGLLDLN